MSVEGRMIKEGAPKAALSNDTLLKWVSTVVSQCQPSAVSWCDGSEEEAAGLFELMVQAGSAIRLKKRKNSYLFRSDPRDVARMESRTFICTRKKEDAGPTNNWMGVEEMKTRLHSLFTGCMRGRTMYIIPFCMGPLGSPIAQYGVQVSDSPYVVVNMRIMTRVSTRVLEYIEASKFFVPCIHSVGKPLAPGERDVAWPCNPTQTHVVHFPAEREIWSFGSGYGGNAILAKKCLALRIASVMAKDEGWLAEHMLILGCESPEGEKTYVTGAFPSQCGKTNFAMIRAPPMLQKKGWKVTTVGDDIAWLKPHKDGFFHAINPENGFFGVCPGTSNKTNPHAVTICSKDSIFTNVALTPDGDVWWEGLTDVPPAQLIDWQGKPWNPDSKTPASHPNARFTSPLTNCPCLDERWNDPEGVPIKAFLYGGRRERNIPLIYQSFNWTHGVYLAATLSSETTSAATDISAKVRNDPMAMLPFCGYNMADYFRHYIKMVKLVRFPPRVFHVNWFRKHEDGSFLWPGYLENMRPLIWVVHRANGQGKATETPLGWMPEYEDLDWDGLQFSRAQWDRLNSLSHEELLATTIDDERLFIRLHDRMPSVLKAERELLIARL